MPACMYAHIYIYTDIHKLACHMCIQSIQMCICSHVCIYIYIYTHVYVYIFINIIRIIRAYAGKVHFQLSRTQSGCLRRDVLCLCRSSERPNPAFRACRVLGLGFRKSFISSANASLAGRFQQGLAVRRLHGFGLSGHLLRTPKTLDCPHAGLGTTRLMYTCLH